MNDNAGFGSKDWAVDDETETVVDSHEDEPLDLLAV